tara:strand:- start:765 stop:1340 length:576 start_codon:yes stop_codon:yes gene_type:complete
MRHANDSGLNRTYQEIKELARNNDLTLGHEDILERMVSLAIDPSDNYVHDEVIEINRQREDKIRQYDEEARKSGHPGVIRRTSNPIIETAKKINQVVSDRPLIIAYNEILRTEFTARAIHKIIGGNLVSGKLYEAYEVRDWMKEHFGEDGASIIVTHEPALARLVHRDVVPFLAAFNFGRNIYASRRMQRI